MYWNLVARSKFRRARFNRAVGWLMLLTFLLALVPIPLSVSLPKGTKSGEAFPCQDSPCGCATAEDCWRNCCCNTPAERLAWAKKHGVKPPSYLAELVAAQEVAQPRSCCKSSAKATSHSSCCSQSSKPGKTPAATSVIAHTVSDKNAEPARKRYVTVIDALKCRGMSIDFQTTPWNVAQTCTAVVLNSFLNANVEERDANMHSVYLGLSTPPPIV